MNDFVAKYKQAQGGAKPRQQNKDQKKGVTKALHETFKMAMTGQISGINHQGVQYLMLRQDVFNDIIQNGGKLITTEEQKVFYQHYQILLNLMQSLNIEDEVESALFDEIDQFTFDFSGVMNDQNGAKKRREILKDFNETIAGNELLASMEKNLRSQMFPVENKEEVENNGKLT